MTLQPGTPVLVTGGSGFTGGHVVTALVERGCDVSALCRSDAAVASVEALGARPVMGDLDDPGSVDRAFAASGATHLANIASLGFGHAPTIISAARDNGLMRAVFVSTTAIFTKLNAPSKAVRMAAERDVTDSDLDWTIVRPTMIYGTPGDRNMWRLVRLVRRSPLVPMPGGGHNLQQPVHVADLAGAIVSALDRPVAIRRAYNVAGPDPISFREVVAATGNAVGRKPRGLSLPARPVIRLLTSVETRTGRSLPVKAEQIERLIEDKAFPIDDAVRDLGYSPRPFTVGIRAEAQMTR